MSELTLIYRIAGRTQRTAHRRTEILLQRPAHPAQAI